jgi:hypothetical protein
MGSAKKMNLDEHPNHPEHQTKSTNQIISKKTVAITFFGSLLLALLITWAFSGFELDVIMFTHLFPLGSLIFISEDDIVLYFGYAIYIAIFLCAFLFRKRPFFITLLVIYILVLCLNISGCVCLFNIDIH